MTAPTVDSFNSNQGSGVAGVTVTLTNAPTAGGVVIVMAGMFSGTGSGTWSCTATGGSGVVITPRLDMLGATNNAVGCLIYTVTYSSAPTALSVNRSAGSGIFETVCCVNVSGQNASYIDVISTGTTGTSTNCVDTNLPNTTDSTDLILGCMTRLGTTETITPAGAWIQVVEIDEFNVIQTLSVVKQAPGSSGSFDPTWTISSSDTWWAGGIAIKGTGGVSNAIAWVKA